MTRQQRLCLPNPDQLWPEESGAAMAAQHLASLPPERRAALHAEWVEAEAPSRAEIERELRQIARERG